MTDKDLDLWEDICKEVRYLSDAEVMNKLKDAEPQLHAQLIKDAQMWISEAIFQSLRSKGN